MRYRFDDIGKRPLSRLIRNEFGNFLRSSIEERSVDMGSSGRLTAYALSGNGMLVHLLNGSVDLHAKGVCYAFPKLPTHSATGRISRLSDGSFNRASHGLESLQ